MYKSAFDAYGVRDIRGNAWNKRCTWRRGIRCGPISNNFTTALRVAVAWTKIGELKHAELPKVVMAKDFDSAWDTVHG